jgi:hypothetical protein
MSTQISQIESLKNNMQMSVALKWALLFDNTAVSDSLLEIIGMPDKVAHDSFIDETFNSNGFNIQTLKQIALTFNSNHPLFWQVSSMVLNHVEDFEFVEFMLDLGLDINSIDLECSACEKKAISFLDCLRIQGKSPYIISYFQSKGALTGEEMGITYDQVKNIMKLALTPEQFEDLEAEEAEEAEE